MVTQDKLISSFNYCKETGIFTRKEKPGFKSFNTKFAGKPSGSIQKNGYISISVDGIKIYAHRAAYLYVTGTLPSQIDHKNKIRTDNRWSNLRASNNFMNSRNQSLRSTNTSGVNGVYWSSGRLKWYVRIGLNGKNLHGGYFHNFDDAVKQRNELNKKLGYFETHCK